MNEGAVLGAAIGDAMGHPTEFLGSFEAICERYGPEGVTQFELFHEHAGRRFAPYTDDTQMAEVVLRTLLAGHSDLHETMQRLAKGFVSWSRDPLGATGRRETPACPDAGGWRKACPGARPAAFRLAAAAR